MGETYYVKELIFDSKMNAEAAKNELLSTVDRYGYATVADAYDLAGLASSYTDNLYGWAENSISGIRVANLIRVRSGYRLELPNAVRIETPTCVTKSTLENYETDDRMVSHPSHYQTSSGMETIQVIEAFTEGLEGIEAVDTAQVIKYVCRWKKKNGLQDLEKAMWYLTNLINHVKEKETK